MALLPYLLDMDVRPARIRHQLFGLDPSPEELIISDMFDRHALKKKYLHPLRHLSSLKDVGSSIKTDKDKFQVNIDVQHFAPEEISVKTADGFITVEGNHEEKEDEHGFVSRQFKRRYAIPKDCNIDAIESRLSTDGVLSLICPKTKVKGERSIPITHTGPVRRKLRDDEENEKKESEENQESDETKSQQKKRRR